MVRKNKNHFVLYNNAGVISATTPKDCIEQSKVPSPIAGNSQKVTSQRI